MGARGTQRAIGVRKASRQVRKFVATANAMLAAGDGLRAYAYAEAAEHAAHDLKHLITGDLSAYDEAANVPDKI
jgi:hypothetical protein